MPANPFVYREKREWNTCDEFIFDHADNCDIAIVVLRWKEALDIHPPWEIETRDKSADDRMPTFNNPFTKTQEAVLIAMCALR